MPRRVVSLVRVSTAAQAAEDREGLPVQREAVQRIARSHGLEVVGEVALEGVSGASVLQDDRFRAMLDRLASERLAGVVVQRLDRLFRKGRYEDFRVLDHFTDAGGRIFTEEGVFDPANDADSIVLVLRGELGGQERRLIARRTREGRERKRRTLGVRAEGLVGLPRGVTFDSASQSWSYVFPEAERVREIFRLWLQTDGTRSLASIGREVGIGGTNPTWAVRGVLRQPLYMGVYRVDRRWVKGRPVPRTTEECYEHAVLEPPLVPRAEWLRAQELLAARPRTRPARRDPDLQDGDYAGFLDCARCGNRLWHQPGSWKNTRWGRRHQNAGYVCPEAEKGCPTGSTSIRLADPVIDQVLADRLGSAEVLERLIEESVAASAARAASDPSETTRRLTEIANQRRRLVDLHLEGLLDLTDFRKRAAALDGERHALEALLSRQSGEIEIDQDVLDALVDVFASWANLERRAKRSILRDYQIRIQVSKPPKTPGVRARLEVHAIRIGLFRDDFTVWKKMKRLGIE